MDDLQISVFCDRAPERGNQFPSGNHSLSTEHRVFLSDLAVCLSVIVVGLQF